MAIGWFAPFNSIVLHRDSRSENAVVILWLITTLNGWAFHSLILFFLLLLEKSKTRLQAKHYRKLIFSLHRTSSNIIFGKISLVNVTGQWVFYINLSFWCLLVRLFNSGYPTLVGWLRAVNDELVTQHTAINQIRAAVKRIEAAVLETPAAAATKGRSSSRWLTETSSRSVIVYSSRMSSVAKWWVFISILYESTALVSCSTRSLCLVTIGDSLQRSVPIIPTRD